jgi:hypothetical protein
MMPKYGITLQTPVPCRVKKPVAKGFAVERGGWVFLLCIYDERSIVNPYSGKSRY